MEQMTMGQRIAQQRKMLGLSQEGLGEKMGVSRQAISKWESDGTVPEIDKLIALSKLFSVSVGWLLGVEESAPRAAELTEAQLKTVEEIVKKYQPAPEPEEKEFRWFPLVLAFLFLFPIVYFLFGRDAPDYSAQISSLQSSYQAIQGELQSLSGQVNDLASAAEEGEKLLLSHEFTLKKLDMGGHTLEPIAESELPQEETETDSWISLGTAVTGDVPIAELTFTAVPRQHNSSDRAWLVVMLKGQPMGQADCRWAGAAYQASFSLWVEDCYEYRFVVEHEDGTQEIQMLEEYDYRDLAYGTSLHCNIDTFIWDYDPDSWIFRIQDCEIIAEKPLLGDHADALWKECGLILTLNGSEIENEVSDRSVTEWDADSPHLLEMHPEKVFRFVKLSEGDILELRFHAALDSGLSGSASLGRWTLEEGNLVMLPEE